MSLFHRHHWTETGRAFVPPRSFDADSITTDIARDLMFGVTFLSLRCRDCGDVMTRKLTGKFVDA